MNLITSSQNSLIKHLIKLRDHASYRKEQGSLFLESKKLVLEALEKGLVKHLIIGQDVKLNSDVQTTRLTLSLSQKISGLKTTEGYFAEVKFPKLEEIKRPDKLLVLDQIQDPGNVGTLIRSAHAFDYDAIILTLDSSDPYSPKALRASMGSSLSIPIYFMSPKGLKEFLESNHYQTLMAHMEGSKRSEIEIKTPFALIMGNESRGSRFKSELSYTPLKIPIKNIDSLNVAIAGSLLMHELVKI